MAGARKLDFKGDRGLSRRADSASMIEVRNLTKRYGDLTAIRGISFTVAKGEVLGFLGPNGAGKTTTMRIVTGYMPASEGTITVDGFDVFENSFEVRKRIGYLPENPPLYGDMTVESFLRFVARIKGVAKNAVGEATEKALETCGLTHVRGRLTGNLSKGYRQRVGLAQALIHDPPVLVLDEPTIGLDPRQIIEIRSLIRHLAGSRTVILSTHILPEVAQICEKVVILSDGRVVLEDRLANLTQGATLEEVFLRAISRDEASEAAAAAEREAAGSPEPPSHA
jgi:ABC-2 type transport system ATP-binding protein